MNSREFSLAKAQKLSESLVKLYKWVIGIVEIHKYLRKYSITRVDDEILSDYEK